MAVRRAVLATAVTLLLHGPAGAQSSPGQPADVTPKFRSSVDLVSVAAVVRDRKGRFVSDLSREDFIVVEGGEPKKIVGFEAEQNGPVKIAVLFDISGSMRMAASAMNARQAARHVFSALKAGDQAALFAFDTRLAEVHGFTTDFATLESAIERVETPYGQTSLYDAIAQTAQVVADAAGGGGRMPQRAAVVVLTDGIDTKSRLTAPQVSGIASSIDVPVYVVAVMAAIDDPARVAAQREHVISGALRDLSQWTGGELFIVSAPAHASLASRQIIEELRNQYLLAFEASSRQGWKPLEIKSRKRNLVVRARSGYIVGGGPSSGVDGRNN